MRRLTSALVAVLLVASAFAAVPAVTMAQETDTATATPTPDGETQPETATADNETDDNESDGNGTDPGAQLAGVVGVSEAELDGELQSRTFGLRVAQAASDGAKADIVGEQLNDSEQRLAELQERKETLQEAHENGSMSEGEYRAKVARLHTEIKTVERLIDETSETASGIPAETLEERGVNATRIETLSERAGELSGPEVAEIARGIAGADASERARSEQARDPGGAGTEDRPGSGADGQDNETAGGGTQAGAENRTSGGGDGGRGDATDQPADSGSGEASNGDGSGGSDAGADRRGR